MLGEVDDAGRVTHLVVVPGDDLHELVVERDARRGVEDRRARVTCEVRRDDGVLGVAQDAWADRVRKKNKERRGKCDKRRK